LKILFVSSGNNYSQCPISFNQANSIIDYDDSIIIEHYRILGKGILGYLRNWYPLRKKIKHFQPDIIHSHYSFSGFLTILTLSKVPKITSLMGSDVQLKGFWKFVLNFFSNFWDEIIVKSIDMKVKCGIDRAIIIPNGVNLHQFEKIDKNEAKKKLGLNIEKNFVLFLADPSRSEKNYKLAKEAVKLCNNKNIELLTVFNIPFNQTKYFYYAADVVLMTSKYEGSPNVIKEAMVCNKPIVSTNVGDVKLLLNAIEGCYITDDNPSAISLSIKAALTFNKETKGKERIIELGIDSESISNKIIKLYRNICHNKINYIQNHDQSNVNIQLCKLGIWDNKVPGIKFDINGISNYAQFQIKMMNDYPLGDKGKKEWVEIIDKIKRESKHKKYHCIIGVSGGVDSSYLLVLASKLGLNPLAVHLDNGFNSEIAVNNIEKITRKLNIDLVTHVVNYEEMKDLFRSYMIAGLPWIDAPTDLAIKAVMYKIAAKYRINYVFRGNDFRSEGKQPTEWTYSDAKQLIYLHKKYGKLKKLNTYPYYTVWNILIGGLFNKIKDIRPYYFIDYNKQNAKKILSENYEWRDYGGHHHENLFTKFAIAYWLPKKFNIDKRKINLSAQILSGAITREFAIDQIEKDFETEKELENLKKFIIKKLDFNNDEFEKLFIAENKKYSDYPNNFNLIYNNIDNFKWIIKRLYGFKPMSIDSKKIIDNK
jgi:N-acetyl sugar amidotransferase